MIEATLAELGVLDSVEDFITEASRFLGDSSRNVDGLWRIGIEVTHALAHALQAERRQEQPRANIVIMAATADVA